MCGFVGIYSKKNNNTDKNFLSNLLNHRGPDMKGSYMDEENNFAIYFNRLSILDLSTNGNQPFYYNNFVLVANCEIYNFRSLKNELAKNTTNFTRLSITLTLCSLDICFA